MSRLRAWSFFACLAAGLAVTGCQGSGSVSKPSGWLNAKPSANSDSKASSKPMPRDTIPSAKEVGL